MGHGSECRSQEIQTLVMWVFKPFLTRGYSSRHSIFTIPRSHTSKSSIDTNRKRWPWKSTTVLVLVVLGFLEATLILPVSTTAKTKHIHI